MVRRLSDTAIACCSPSPASLLNPVLVKTISDDPNLQKNRLLESNSARKDNPETDY